jgi:uncharacterized protein with HEPN domain
MKRDFKLFLNDIIAACKHIQKFVEGMDFEQFQDDEKTSSAVIRKFEIIGEAAKNIPDFIKEKYPQIDWKDMAGMRDRLIHGYFGVDYLLVWETIEYDVPRIISIISQIIKDLEQEQDTETTGN